MRAIILSFSLVLASFPALASDPAPEVSSKPPSRCRELISKIPVLRWVALSKSGRITTAILLSTLPLIPTQDGKTGVLERVLVNARDYFLQSDGNAAQMETMKAFLPSATVKGDGTSSSLLPPREAADLVGLQQKAKDLDKKWAEIPQGVEAPAPKGDARR